MKNITYQGGRAEWSQSDPAHGDGGDDDDGGGDDDGGDDGCDQADWNYFDKICLMMKLHW